MIIDKNTSDALLVNSIRVFGNDGKPLVKIKLFDTSSLVATKHDDQTEVCIDFGFFINHVDKEAVDALVGAELVNKVIPGHKTAHGFGPSSMVYEETDPDHLLTIESQLKPILLKCSSCETYFVVFLDREGGLWSTVRTNPADKHLTATELDKSSLTCDNCSNDVTLIEN